MLALHGLTASRAVWRPLAERLPTGLALLAPDLPGRGESPPAPSGRYRLRDELRRLRSALASRGASPRVVVGHSQGAALAVALASTDPSVRALILCSPVCPWTSRPPLLDLLRGAGPAARRIVPPLRRPVVRWVLRHRVYADPTRADGAAVDRYAGPWASPGRAAELPGIVADWNPSALWPYFPPPPIRLRVLVGEEDRRVPPEDAARLARAAAGEIRVLSGAAHGLPEERPDAVASALAAVAAESRAGSEREGDARFEADSSETGADGHQE
ncbi:MAG: alpha/beta hydrolase [Candidatus Palauibacterales bacterium]|nr:alpha/beta hydrolase [Candidatus Palauibacterales bacterium]